MYIFNHLKFSLRILRGAVLATALAACAPGSGEGEGDGLQDYWVNSFKVRCEGVAPMDCLQVHKGEAPFGEWRNFYAPIEGFDYRPGSLYRIRVRETRLPPEQVPADASSIRYELVEVLETRPDPRAGLMDIFVLRELAGVPVSEYQADTSGGNPTIEFHIPRDAYLGFDGCSEFSGELLEVNEQTLRLGPVATDGAPCGQLQVALADALSAVESWQRDGLELRLFNSGGDMVLVYRKVD